MNLAIIIPARYGSTRFPGKPLAVIAGKTMLERVVDAARAAAASLPNVTVMVATEDKRIADLAGKINAECVMTSAKCATGSDRVLEAIKKSGGAFDFVVNLQGDAPFTPPDVIVKIIEAYKNFPRHEVITPVHQLSWKELDALREAKKTTPFSGTTAILDERGRTLWFSKSIIPLMRDEDALRKKGPVSPVFQHIGLYGFRMDTLEKFCALPPGKYEMLEGLEQLRLLENGIKIQSVNVDIDSGLMHSGIDSPEDLKRAEEMLNAKANAAKSQKTGTL